MSQASYTFKQQLYYRATLLFPSFFSKRFFAGLHKGVKSPDHVQLLPEKEFLVVYLLLPENNVAIDVGANNGAYSYFFKQLTRSARVLAFEPLPGLFRKLQVWLKNIELYPYALSNSTGEATIRIPVISNRLYESRAKLDNLSEEHESGRRELRIRTARLDDVLAGMNLERLDLIKIDIEGHELKAIEGARLSIARYRPWLLIEIEKRHHGGSIDRAIAEVCALGYTAWYFNYATRQLEAFASYRPQEMQDPRHQNTFAYINNFLFMPAAQSAEIDRVNRQLKVFFNLA